MITVSGSLQEITGSAAASSNSYVRFWMRGTGGNQPFVSGTALLAPNGSTVWYADMVPDASGNVSGNLYSTSEVSAGGQTSVIWYGMQVFQNGFGGPESPVSAAGNININNPNILSTLPVVTAPTGDSTYLRLDATNSPVTGTVAFSGGINTKTQNQVLHVGPSGYANIAAAQTAAGVVNPTIITIDSNYAGTDCPSFQSNLIFLDYRGTSSPAGCIQNEIMYNVNDGNVKSLTRTYMEATSITNSGAAVSHWFQTFLNGGNPGIGATLDGASTEAVTTNALGGTLLYMNGNESVSNIESTSGTVTNASGLIGYVSNSNTSTTAITTARGVWGMGCNGCLGVQPSNVYSLYGSDMTGQGSSRSYSIGLEGKGLLLYSGTGANAGLDMEDSAHAVHTFIVYDGTNTTIQTVGTDTLFKDNAGAIQAQISTGGLGYSGLTNRNTGNLVASAVAPTISSGFGTSPSIATHNGTIAFTINVGTGGTATNGVIGLPTAAHGWWCYFSDITTQSSTVFVTRQIATSATTATIANFNTAGAQAAWVASDILVGGCVAY